MLGRPFGAPNDAAFQRRVVLHLLSLFERPHGPVLEDFPEEAPDDPGDAEGYACPVNFERAPLAADDLAGALVAEIAQLAVWHEEARRRRGRSTVGIAGIAGMPVEDSARLIGSLLTGAAPGIPQSEVAFGTLLKRCCDDIKAYYFEAPVRSPASSRHARSTSGSGARPPPRAFMRLREVGLEHPEASVRLFVERSLVPRAILHANAQA